MSPFAWVNDASASAYRAAGLGVLDVETMLVEYVLMRTPDRSNGYGDKLHF